MFVCDAPDYPAGDGSDLDFTAFVHERRYLPTPLRPETVGLYADDEVVFLVVSMVDETMPGPLSDAIGWALLAP